MSDTYSSSSGDTANDKNELETQKELFKTCMESESEQRTQMQDDIRFARLGEQWPEAIKKMRSDDNRPMLTINKMPSFIRQVVNDARQNRPQIKIKPVDEKSDRKTADVFAGLIKQIEINSNADAAYDTALDHSCSCGLGYFRINVDYASELSFDKKLTIKRISNPFSVYGDPAGKEVDSSDWNKAFLIDYMSKDDFKAEYKGAEEVDWDNTDYTGLTSPWMEDSLILLAESWQREKTQKEIILLSNGTVIDAEDFQKLQQLLLSNGITPGPSRKTDGFKVVQRLMTGAEILSKTEWSCKYIPIVPVYGEEIYFDNKRIFNSLIHQAVDSQRMFNYWRSASTELVALAPRVPWIGEEGAFTKVDSNMVRKWQNANTKSYPYLEYKKGMTPPSRLMLDSGPAAGALSEAANANDDMKAVIGLYDASLGARSNEVSGRAIMARQREGDVSTFHFIDNLNRAIRHAGCILVDLIPKTYSPGRILRITNYDGTQQAIQLGPVSAPGPMPGMAAQQTPPGMPPALLGGGPLPPNVPMQGAPNSPMTAPPGMGPPGMPPMPPPPQDNPVLDVYDLSVGEYDVVVDTGPSVTSRREELGMQMTEFIKVFPTMFPIIGDILVKSLDWPNADIIADRIKGMQAGQAQQNQIQQENQMLKLQVQMLQAGLNIKEEQAKTQQFQAETDRVAKFADIQQSDAKHMLEQTNTQIAAADTRINALKTFHEMTKPQNSTNGAS